MGIKSTYNSKQLDKDFQKQFEKLKNEAISKFFELGKRTVDICFSDGNYINRTGVLRSSIGCGVYFNGVLVKQYGFFPVASEGDAGAKIGKDFMEELSKRNVKFNQINLIIVAGAEHASFVEENSNFVVLESGTEFLENHLLSIIKQIIS